MCATLYSHAFIPRNLSPEVTARTVALMKQLGQSPITLLKEVNGFVLNRLQVHTNVLSATLFCPHHAVFLFFSTAHHLFAQRAVHIFYQYAWLAEAWRLVEDGVCSPDDVDTAVSQGLGLRYSFMGPFETIDLNADGVVDYCEVAPLAHRISSSTHS